VSGADPWLCPDFVPPPGDVVVAGAPAPELEDPPPPHAVRRGRERPPTAAPVRARRRLIRGSVTGRLLVVGGCGSLTD
jgi:hypothetical protein